MSSYDYELGYTAGFDAARKRYERLGAVWIRKKIDERHYHYFCSRCGYCSKYRMSKYCPDCGRPMQKGGKQ